MSRFLAWNLTVYRILLMMYPNDVRGEFEAEILEAFENDIWFECSARGVGGAVRVWRVALRELICIGLPAWLQIPSVVVPLLSATVYIVSQALLLMISITNDAGRRFRPGDNMGVNTALPALAIGAAMTALISFVAVYPRKQSKVISLDIGRSLCWKPEI